MIARPDDPAPENFNPEQEDEETQAQSVAKEAQDRATSPLALEDSDKVKGGVDDEDDVEDLVDHMNQMDTSGVIDMSAYRGEETMDDLENRFGKAGVADEDFEEDDS